jgi:phosphate transport system permease protein
MPGLCANGVDRAVQRRRRSAAIERVVEFAVTLCGWSAIAVVAAILAFVVHEAMPALGGGLDLREFLTSPNWRPDSAVRPQFGALALFAGTASVTLLAMLLSVPTGVGAAMFMSEFCGPRLRETLKVGIELLAAIPSVVWGFVGYVVLNPLLIWIADAPVGLNVLNGAIILALMSAPIVVSVAEDALAAVPDSCREAALALGASRAQIAIRVLLPAARSGLLAAALLGVGRAIGETIAVLMVTGHAVQIPTSVFDPVRTLTATIAAELGESVQGSVHYRVLFVIGSVLVLISMAVNVTADLAVHGTSRRSRR